MKAKKKFMLPVDQIVHGYAIIYANSRRKAVEYINSNGVVDLDFVDSNTEFEYDIDDLVEEVAISENESICSNCGKKMVDEFETKFDEDADPYCADCFEEIQDKLRDRDFEKEETLLEEAREKYLEKKHKEK